MRPHRTFALLLVLFATPALAADDHAAIEDVIRVGYVEGVHLDRDGDKMRQGFHESFRMALLRDGAMSELGRDAWIERIEAWKRDTPTLDYETSWELVDLQTAGDAAVAQVTISRDDALVYTDFLSLYRFPDGWKIVGKIFHDHR